MLQGQGFWQDACWTVFWAFEHLKEPRQWWRQVHQVWKQALWGRLPHHPLPQGNFEWSQRDPKTAGKKREAKKGSIEDARLFPSFQKGGQRVSQVPPRFAWTKEQEGSWWESFIWVSWTANEHWFGPWRLQNWFGSWLSFLREGASTVIPYKRLSK